MSSELTLHVATGEYSLPPFDLKWCVVALQRFLLSRGPKEAERAWWLRGVVPSHTNGKWLQLLERGEEPFFILSDGVRGRSSFTLPADVRPDDLSVISLPSPVPRILYDYFVRLIEQFDDNNAEDRVWKNTLSRRASLIREMYNVPLALPGPSPYLSALLAATKQHSTPLIDGFVARVSLDFTSFQISGPLAAELYLMGEIVRLALPYRYLFEPLGYLLESALVDDTLESILLNILEHSIAPPTMFKVIAEACKNLQSRGEEFLHLAEDADAIGQFYGLIFSSQPLILAAGRGLKFLLAKQEAGEEARVAVNVCAELGTVGNLVMQVQFADSLDHRDLLSWREWIDQRRKESGEAAAEQLADQCLETNMFYPSFARAYLLGQTEYFPNYRSAL